MALNSILNPIMDPLLSFKPWFSLLLIAFVLTIIITLIYKYTTNQKLMKQLRDEQKKFQKEMKEVRNNPDKLMKIQKVAMQKNFEYMKHSLKATLFTFIPIIIIFGWLNSNISFYAINPDTEFTVTAYFKQGTTGNITLQSNPVLMLNSSAMQEIKDDKAQWKLQGAAGNYTLSFDYGIEPTKIPLLITSGRKYETPIQKVQGSNLQQLVIGNKPLRPFGNLSLLGWHPGWLGTYIIYSIILSILLRKLLKVH